MSHSLSLRLTALAAVLSLSACAPLNQLNLALGGGDLRTEPTVSAPGQTQAIPTGSARTAEALDQSTAEERVAATRSRGAGRALGQTVASLGTPSEPGFWLKTPLVSAQSAGRVRNPATGKSVAVTLIPIDGPATAGSRMSLSAMRALEVGLADLVTVDVSS
ncbi:hypothetical protein [uncultured Roseobacter sp.]|uniref:hypothetical protein n=1 Tax=uncultured Roseobacter sp. TaxID=114847 RepID=UPI00263320D7|nr:hypothetical protein [uncultured Roseobacter sp.]